MDLESLFIGFIGGLFFLSFIICYFNRHSNLVKIKKNIFYRQINLYHLQERAKLRRVLGEFFQDKLDFYLVNIHLHQLGLSHCLFESYSYNCSEQMPKILNNCFNCSSYSIYKYEKINYYLFHFCLVDLAYGLRARLPQRLHPRMVESGSRPIVPCLQKCGYFVFFFLSNIFEL